MDVKGKGLKEVSGAKVKPAQDSAEVTKPGKQKLARSLATAQALTTITDVKVEVSKRKPAESTELRTKANSVINAVNVAEEATAEIEKLVKSVGGIVDQAEKDETNTNRLSILESEAQQLVAEIKKQSQVDFKAKVSTPAAPIADDRFRIEENLERTLQALFQEGATSAFGISDIALNRKENIINVRTSIQLARDRVSELRSKLSEAKEQVETSVVAFEVALENSQSATTSLRDVDEALRLATDTKSVIGKQPETAVNVSKITLNSLDLLQ